MSGTVFLMLATAKYSGAASYSKTLSNQKSRYRMCVIQFRRILNSRTVKFELKLTVPTALNYFLLSKKVSYILHSGCRRALHYFAIT